MVMAWLRKNGTTKKYIAISSSHNRDNKKKKGCDLSQNNASPSTLKKRRKERSLEKMVAKGFQNGRSQYVNLY